MIKLILKCKIKIQKIILLLTLLILSACISEPNTIFPKEYKKTFDISTNIKSAGIGDTIFEEGDYLIYDTLNLKEDYESQFGPSWDYQKVFIPAQQLVAREEDEKFTYYFGSNVTFNSAVLGIRSPTERITGGFKVRKKAASKEKNNILVFVGLQRQTFFKAREPIVEKSQITKTSKTGDRKELIFGGKQDGLLIFKYFKKGNDRLKKYIERDIKFDPSEKTLLVDGIKVEVISHSSIKLEYRISVENKSE